MLRPACGVVLRGKSAAGGGAAAARGPDQQRLHLPAPLAGGIAGGCGRGGAGRAGGAPLSGPGRRAGIPRPAHRGRHSAGCPGLLRHRLFSAGAAFGPGGGAGAVRCRAGPPAARPGYLSGAALCRGCSPARPGAGGAPCSLHHRGRALYPAGRPGQPVLHRLPRRAGQGRAPLCRLCRPPPAA